MNGGICQKPELAVAAGDWSSLNSALAAGADAIYFGIKDFNLRINAANFELNEIPKVITCCQKYGAKSYLTLNSIFFDSDNNKLKRVIKAAGEYGIDAVICWDFAVVNEVLRAGIPVHLSTQASVSNFEAIAFFYKLGIKRIVLARECSLAMIEAIIKKIKAHGMDLVVEVFIHGALCVSISGRCFVSEYLFGRSANRGDCLQPCRRKYVIRDIDEEGELAVEDGYILSPQDLCTIDIIDLLIKAGIGAFKIEGRTRSCDYIKVTTEAYRNAIDNYYSGGLNDQKKEEYLDILEQVYNRGFSHGFYFGTPLADLSGTSGSRAQQKKVYLGDVLRFFSKISVAEVLLRNNDCVVGDKLLFTGKKTGSKEHIIHEIEIDHTRIKRASKGSKIAIKTDFVVRKGDKVFLLKPNKAALNASSQ
ncbi:MAG: U32 family peptidase [Candidatus Omnitrophica bacterium]|nr:U32 family peptidase [Candidatus Omnitrophota bacterium]